MKADEVYQCGKCGLCLNTCPVYSVMREETASPRAKVHLVRSYAEERLPATERMQALIQRCLMCGTCTAVCPGGVQHDTLFMRMRATLSEACGESWESKALGKILPSEERLRLASRLARLGAGALVQMLAQKARVGNIPFARLPEPNRQPFRDQIADRIEPEGALVGTLSYFTGCATNHIYERTGHAVVNVLRRMGYRVIIPGSQVCCALPLFFHGKPERAIQNILKNIDVLLGQGADHIVVDCATCGSALRKEYPRILEEFGLPVADARRLAAKVRDVSEFVIANRDRLSPHLAPRPEPDTVTYHTPCHLKNSPGGKVDVEDLLKGMPHVAYRRAPDCETCCGGGGLFFYEYPEISKKLVEKKIDNARKTGSGFWATGCPGCRFHLTGNMSENDSMEVCHPLEIVERGLV